MLQARRALLVVLMMVLVQQDCLAVDALNPWQVPVF
jgi:hypothetical protein